LWTVATVTLAVFAISCKVIFFSITVSPIDFPVLYHFFTENTRKKRKKEKIKRKYFLII